MKGLLAIFLLGLLAASTGIAGEQDWYVIKTASGDPFAYQLKSQDSVAGVWILRLTSDGNEENGYWIDCHTDTGELIDGVQLHNGQETLLMTEGNAKPSDPGWGPIPTNGSMRIAADVACKRNTESAVRVDSQQAAIDKLKTLSN